MPVPAAHLDITVYTTELCTYCQEQKGFLREHDIAFKEVRVDNDTEAADAMIKRSGQMSVPYTIISSTETEEEIAGFDALRLAKALGI